MSLYVALLMCAFCAVMGYVIGRAQGDNRTGWWFSKKPHPPKDERPSFLGGPEDSIYEYLKGKGLIDE